MYVVIFEPVITSIILHLIRRLELLRFNSPTQRVTTNPAWQYNNNTGWFMVYLEPHVLGLGIVSWTRWLSELAGIRSQVNKADNESSVSKQTCG